MLRPPWRSRPWSGGSLERAPFYCTGPGLIAYITRGYGFSTVLACSSLRLTLRRTPGAGRFTGYGSQVLIAHPAARRVTAKWQSDSRLAQLAWARCSAASLCGTTRRGARCENCDRGTLATLLSMPATRWCHTGLRPPACRRTRSASFGRLTGAAARVARSSPPAALSTTSAAPTCSSPTGLMVNSSLAATRPWRWRACLSGLSARTGRHGTR